MRGRMSAVVVILTIAGVSLARAHPPARFSFPFFQMRGLPILCPLVLKCSTLVEGPARLRPRGARLNLNPKHKP